MRLPVQRPLTWLLLVLAGGLAAAFWVQRSDDALAQLDHHAALTRSDDGKYTLTLLSQRYALADRYQSMEGPSSLHPELAALPHAPDQTVWLTGISVDLLSPDAKTAVSPEFFCHSNLTFAASAGGPEAHNRSFPQPTHADWRLFTLVPGKLSLQLPPGFGLPVKGGALLDNFTMALNQNPENAPPQIRMRTRLHFDDGSRGPLAALFRRAVYVYQQHRETAPSQEELCGLPGQDHAGQACALSLPENQKGDAPSAFASLGQDQAWHPGQGCCVPNASAGGVVEQFGQENTVHWLVPQGTHQYRSEVTAQLKLPASTTAHYVTGHLHPYGDWLRLVDLSNGEIVFEIQSQDFDDRYGVRTMTEIASQQGVPIHNDRRYELVTQYTNPHPEPVDVMAILYLYLKEPNFAVASAP